MEMKERKSKKESWGEKKMTKLVGVVGGKKQEKTGALTWRIEIHVADTQIPPTVAAVALTD